jgi:hypothetical protein
MGAYNNVLWAIGSCGRCIFDYSVGVVLVVVYLVSNACERFLLVDTMIEMDMQWMSGLEMPLSR